MSEILSDMNDDELAAKYHEAVKYRKKLEDALKNHPNYVSAGEDIEAISKIFTTRLHDRGATSINTPHGTIHTVGKTTARIMDPVLFQDWAWQRPDGKAYIDWKANMTACRSHMEETGEPVPGVELSTFRRLSITAPKG
jgi:hypothetical protein